VTGTVRGVGAIAGIVCGLVAAPASRGLRIALLLTDRRTPRFVLPSGLFVLLFAPFAVVDPHTEIMISRSNHAARCGQMGLSPRSNDGQMIINRLPDLQEAGL
jgi:hypothetical protein